MVSGERKASRAREDPDVRLDLPVGEVDSAAVARSSRQTAVSQIVMQGVRLLTSVVLARLLAPNDFGIVAIALVLSTVIDQVKDLGMGAAIIQRPTVDQVLLNSVFCVNLAMGALAAIGLLVLAAPLAALLGNSSAAPVISAFAGITLVSAFGQIHQSILRRMMQFRKIAWVTASSAIATAVSSIAAAAAGAGYWSLVLGTAVGTTVGTVLLWRFDEWRPTASVSFSSLASIWGFSWHIFMTNVLYLAWSQADKVIVGRGAGPAALGVYTMAQRVVSTPLWALNTVIAEVTFPAFSRRQDDNAALRFGFTRSTAVIALVTFPLMVGVAAVATPMVAVVFGPKWADLAPLIQVLAPAGAIHSVTYNCGPMLLAKGRSDWTYRWGILHLVVLVGCELLFVRWGAVGVAIGYATGVALITPFTLILTFRVIEMRFRDFFAALIPYIWITAAMMGSVVFVTWWCRSLGAPALAELAAGVTIGIVVYGVLLWIARPPAAGDALRSLRGSLT